MIIIGSILYGIGTICFIKAGGIATGGLTGLINIINNYIYEIPIGLTTILINIPLIIVSFVKFGKKFVVSTLFGLAISSFCIDVCDMFLQPYLPFTNDILLSAFAGGVLNGTGLGLVMKAGSSTGGTNIIIKLLHLKWKHLKGGTINATLSFMICCFYLLITHNVEGALYTVIVIILDNLMFNFVLYGISTSKTVYIITENADEMVSELFNKINIGATILTGKGGFSKAEKQIVLCVVRNHTFPEFKKTVKEKDKNAFMIVTKSSEIFGNGYKDFEKEVL